MSYSIFHDKLDLLAEEYSDDESDWARVRQVGAMDSVVMANEVAWQYFTEFVWTSSSLHISGAHGDMYAEDSDNEVHRVYVKED